MDQRWFLVMCLALSLGHATWVNTSAIEIDTTTAASLNATTTKDSSTEDVTLSEDTEERVSYEGAQLLRVEANTNEMKEELLQLEEDGLLDVWGEISYNSTTVDVLVKPVYDSKVKEFFRKNDVTYNIVIENIEKLIEPERSQSNLRALHAMTWNAYHSLEDIYGYMAYLETTYPTVAKVMTIGTSVEGRPIKLLRITPTTIGVNAILGIVIEGGLHGRDWVSISSAVYVMREVVENPTLYAAFGVNNMWFYIIPVANPDGYEHSRKKDRLWRKNRKKGTKHDSECYGVDLNRNFGYKWGGAGSSGKECKETYRGVAAFSEPESAAIRDFIATVKTTTATYFPAVYLSFQAYGQYILQPWSYDRVVNPNRYAVNHVKANAMANYIEKLSRIKYTVGSHAATLYPASGTVTDWVESETPFNAFTVLLRDKGRYGFLLPAHRIIPTGADAMQIICGIQTSPWP